MALSHIELNPSNDLHVHKGEMVLIPSLVFLGKGSSISQEQHFMGLQQGGGSREVKLTEILFLAASEP